MAKSNPSRPRFRLPALNPILLKDMRGHMRAARAFRLLTIYLVALSLLGYALYHTTIRAFETDYAGQAQYQSAFIGQTLFAGLALLEVSAICLLAPALTANAISAEAERRTADMLLATPLRPLSIVIGKVSASLSFLFLLILAALPISSIVYVFGGVAFRDVIQVLGLLVLTAIGFGSLGLFFSALTRRTSHATILSYLVTLGLAGSMFAWAVANALGAPPPPRQILYANPFSALASAILTPASLGSMHGTAPTVRLLTLLAGGPDALGFFQQPPLWRHTVTLYVIVSALLLLATARLLDPTRSRAIARRKIVVKAPAILIWTAGGALLALALFLGTTIPNRSGASTHMPPTPTRSYAPATPYPTPYPTSTPYPTPATTPTPVPPVLSNTVRINFQPAGADVPDGYLPDAGDAYAPRGGGLTFGWTQQMAETRDHDVNADQRYDTLNHMQKYNASGVWEFALAPGAYLVNLVMGDPLYPNQVNNVYLEAISLPDPDGEDNFDAYENVVVTVDDGRLTIQPAHGAHNAKLCFVEIAPLPTTVQNPGFESTPYDPTARPDFWEYTSLSGAMLVWDNSEAYSGSQSVRVEALAPDYGFWTQAIQVEPNTDYVLSGWVKTEDVVPANASHPVGAYLSAHGAYENAAGLVGTKDWTYVKVPFNSGNVRYVHVTCQLGHEDYPATGTVWCDDIELRRQ